jgi:exopolysaccharide biosynthesis polyprenyl glycosylphosphotransferase
MLVSTKKTSYLRFILYGIDSVAVVVLLWLLLFIYGVNFSVFLDSYLYLSIFTPIYSFTVFCVFSIYRSWYGLKLYREFILITKVWSTTIALLLFLFFALKVSSNFSRVVILSWFAITPIMIFALHVIGRYSIKFIKRGGGEPEKAIIVGVNDTSKSIVATIETSPWSMIEVLGFFDDKDQESSLSIPILGKIDELGDYLRKTPIDYVYIALSMKEEHKIHRILSSCRSFGAELFFVPSLQFLRMYTSEIQLYGDLILLSFTPRFHTKRVFDLAFSVFAIICFLPVGLLVSLLIKMEDGGPIFYGHRRIALAGKPFKCWKFRTMVRDAEERLAELLNNDPNARAEWERTYKLRNDPRVTRVGKFLRKTSLDEIPQFFNVLRGDMSIVGARPIVEDELCNYYKDDAGSYCSMRPGITGLWQCGNRSDTEKYEERVKLDVWYFLNHSVWIDLKIIFKTILSVVTGKGAR